MGRNSICKENLMAFNQAFRRRPGFTPVELVVVLALILIGLAFLAPILARIRSMAGQTQSLNNLKQLGLASHGYIDTHRKLPPAVGSAAPNEPDKLSTAHYCLLPFVEQFAIFNNSGGSPWQNGAAATPVRLFADPRDASAPSDFVCKGWLATTSYPCNWLVFKDGTQKFPAAIPDGTSNTLMFAQRYQMCNGNPTAWGYADLYYWAPMFAYYNTEKFQLAPPPADCDPSRPQSIGGSSILTGFCDGSARAIRSEIRALTWYYLCDPADGNAIPADAF
jgi:type II secretory pathway pseudopilin PulG